MRFFQFALAGALVVAACEGGAFAVVDDLPREQLPFCLTELGALARAEDYPDSHPFDLNKHCPPLAEDLASSTDAAAIGAHETDAMSIEGLRDLRFIAGGFDRKPAGGEIFSPNFGELHALLADVLIEESIDDDLWRRFVRWLEEYTKGGESPQLEWLIEWLEDLDPPSWLAEVLWKGSVLLIVLLALMVVGNELRLSGVMGRMRKRHKPQAAVGTPGAIPAQRAMSLEDLGALPPRQLAAAILEIITRAFADRGWLSSTSSLTNGELVRQLAQQQTALSDPFAGLVQAIEKVIYGDRLPDDAATQRLVASAHELIERARVESTAAPGGTG
jgi:hypothetical protein